jgi:hypothetical protein
VTLPAGITEHAAQRASERLGRGLTYSEWLAVLEAITGRSAVLLRAMEGRCIYAVPLAGITLRVIWCPLHATVVTVLPAPGRTPYRPTRPARHSPESNHAR